MATLLISSHPFSSFFRVVSPSFRLRIHVCFSPFHRSSSHLIPGSHSRSQSCLRDVFFSQNRGSAVLCATSIPQRQIRRIIQPCIHKLMHDWARWPCGDVVVRIPGCLGTQGFHTTLLIKVSPAVSCCFHSLDLQKDGTTSRP